MFHVTFFLPVINLKDQLRVMPIIIIAVDHFMPVVHDTLYDIYGTFITLLLCYDIVH